MNRRGVINVTALTGAVILRKCLQQLRVFQIDQIFCQAIPAAAIAPKAFKGFKIVIKVGEQGLPFTGYFALIRISNNRIANRQVLMESGGLRRKKNPSTVGCL